MAQSQEDTAEAYVHTSHEARVRGPQNSPRSRIIQMTVSILSKPDIKGTPEMKCVLKICI